MKKWLTKKITREHLDKFLRAHKSNKRTLDLGSSWSPYQKYFPNRVSCDIEARDGVDVVADAHSLPFDNGEFELVLCTEVLEHLHTPQKAIAEIHRVLEKGGTLILTTRFMFPMHDVPHDYFRFTETGMRHLFSEFQIKELIPETRNFETLAVLIHRMAFMMDLKGGKFTRIILFLLAKIVRRMGFLVKKDYGKRFYDGGGIECNTYASGYYLVATK